MSIFHVQDKLRHAIEQGTLSHAYIISGGVDWERMELSVWIAAVMQCTAGPAPCRECSGCRKTFSGIHPDVSFILSEKQSITIDLIREMAAEAFVRPNEGRRRIFIIPEAERLNIAAQNAMLKVLEEPPATATFILLTNNPKSLLQTVRSRCIQLSISPEEQSAGFDEETEKQAKELVEVILAGDALELTRFCTSIERKKRNEMSELLLAAKQRLSELSRIAVDDRKKLESVYSALRTLEKAWQYCSSNVSSAHIAGFLSVSFV